MRPLQDKKLTPQTEKGGCHLCTAVEVRKLLPLDLPMLHVVLYRPWPDCRVEHPLARCRASVARAFPAQLNHKLLN